MIPERVLEPFTEAAFRTGVVIGLILLAVGVVAALIWRSGSSDPLPAAGLFIAAAGVLVLGQVDEPAPGLVAGVIALGLAGLLADALAKVRPFLPLLALPGAWLLAIGVEVEQPWAHLAIGATVVGGGALVAAFDRRRGARRLGPAMVVVSLAGVFITVPETKEALPVLGAALPLALLGWPSRLATLGAGGSLAAVGLLAWTVGQGGTFRDTAIVGGLACLGLLVAEPVGRALVASPGHLRQPPPWVLMAMLVVHGAVVFVAARVAGLGDNLGVAVAVAAVALATGVGAVVALARSSETRAGDEARL